MMLFKRVMTFFIAVGFVYGGEVSAKKTKVEDEKSGITRSTLRLKPETPKEEHILKIENLPNGRVRITESDQTSRQGKKREDFSYSNTTKTMTYSAQQAPEAIAKAKARAAKAEKDRKGIVSTQPKKIEPKASQRNSFKKKSSLEFKKRREAVKKRIQQNKPAVQRATVKTKEKAKETGKRVVKKSKSIHAQSKVKLKAVKERIANRRSLRKKKTLAAPKKTMRAKKASDSARNPKKGSAVKRTAPTTKKFAAEKKKARVVRVHKKTADTKRATPAVKLAKKGVAKKRAVTKSVGPKKTPTKTTTLKKTGSKKYRVKVGDFPPEVKQLFNTTLRTNKTLGRDEEIPDDMILPLSAKDLREMLSEFSELEPHVPGITQRMRNILKNKYGFEG
jgi:hypothetical protein